MKYGGHLNTVKPVLQGHLNTVKPVFRGHLNTVKPVFRGHLNTVKPVFRGHLYTVKPRGHLYAVKPVLQGHLYIPEKVFFRYRFFNMGKMGHHSEAVSPHQNVPSRQVVLNMVCRHL